jgi:hypothetical protein
MATLKSTAAVIDALGGNAEAAAVLEVAYNSITNWRMFGRFPTNTFVQIQRELEKRGHTAPAHLWSMRGTEKRKSRVS